MFFQRRYILLPASKVTAGAIISENGLVIFQLRNLVSADDARDMMITVWSRRYPKTSSLFGKRSPSGISKTIGNISNRGMNSCITEYCLSKLLLTGSVFRCRIWIGQLRIDVAMLPLRSITATVSLS